MSAETSELAWHFLCVTNGVPILRDGRPAPAIGEWLEHDGAVQICASGLHASRRALDALNYLECDGGVACLVEVDDVLGVEDDKLVCRRRRIVGMVPCDEILRIFAREQALTVAHLWDMPPLVREYLETGNEEIRDAAWAAARAAAWAAARDAAWAAAWAAARDAARDAAWAAAWAAARDAAWDAANDLLESALLTEMGL